MQLCYKLRLRPTPSQERSRVHSVVRVSFCNDALAARKHAYEAG